MERPFTYTDPDSGGDTDSAARVNQDLYYEFVTDDLHGSRESVTHTHDGTRTEAHLYPLAEDSQCGGHPWQIGLRASSGDSFRSFVPRRVDCIEYPDGEVSLSISCNAEPVAQYDEVSISTQNTDSGWWPIREAYVSEIHTADSDLSSDSPTCDSQHSHQTVVEVYTNVTFDV
jgi:hypothetical protein